MTVDLDRVRAMLDRRPKQDQARPTNLTATARTWFRITNAGPAAEVWIYDEIGAWGVTAGDFVAALTATQAADVTVHINSPGGEVWDGLAIYHALRAHPATVTVSVDGAALSAASFIAMAGDRIVTAAQSQWMIHDAGGVCMGTCDDMGAMSEVLDQLSQMIAEIYHDRARGGVAKWRGLMRAETWFPAQDAVDAGLADEVGVAARRTEDEPATAGWQARPPAAAGAGGPAAGAATAVPAQPAPEPEVGSTGTGKHPPAAASPPSPAAAGPHPEPEVPGPGWTLDPAAFADAVVRGAAPAHAAFDPARLVATIRGLGQDAPAAEPVPARAFPMTPAAPVPAAVPAPDGRGWSPGLFAAAVAAVMGDVPAAEAPHRAPTVLPPLPRPEPEPAPEPPPDPTGLSGALIRAAIDQARNDVPAPPDPAPPGPAPTADADRTIDLAALRASLREAQL